MRALLVVMFLAALAAFTADYRPPAGVRPVVKRPGGESILPGGRSIAPLGRQYQTGPGPWGLAISPNGKRIVSADGGPRGFSLSLLENRTDGWRIDRKEAVRKADDAPESDDEFRSVFMGLAFENNDDIYASEGNSGRVRLLDITTGKRKQLYDLNTGGFSDSYTGDIAHDPKRRLLYVVDQANFRVAIIDTRKQAIIANVRTGRLPFAITLSPDAKRIYVTNIGMFEYSPIPGASRSDARATGLPFAAFGFPSKDAEQGAERTNGAGQAVQVPGLGNPNVKESNSLTVIDVENPASPEILAFIPTGLPFGQGRHGGSSPSAVAAHDSHIYVANGHNDSITVINAKTLQVEEQILLRIPGLEHLRGILPTGLTIDGHTLYVAEAGINAVGVVDLRARKQVAHLPAGWFPTRIAVRDGSLYVTNAKGHGIGPNASMTKPFDASFITDQRRGTISIYPIPDHADHAKHTARVFQLNGFNKPVPAPKLPEAIQYVVVIVKENRTFDEVFGDIVSASNAPVNGAWDLARYGQYAVVTGDRGAFQSRASLKNVAVTPNHHALAEQFAFSDNFYADSEVSVDGHHWLVGSYPNAWTESTLMAAYGGKKNFRFPTSAPGRRLFAESNSSVHPEEQLEAGALWHHLEKFNIPFRNFGEGFELAGIEEGPGMKPTGGRFLTNVPMPDPLFRNTSREYPVYNTNIPDQFRANAFIAEMERRYIVGNEKLPRFIYVHLPNDHTAKPRPEDGYPYAASYVADNDYALGRIIEFLSKSPWWKQMAVFVTEDDAQGGVDHVDSHRTLLLVASPYARKNYVSKTNVSFPGLLKTAFQLLKLPPLNLYDATAADLSDVFTDSPDFTPYAVKPIRSELFDPAKAKDPLDPKPGPRMDDPKVLREQHQQP
ncbi:MAG TPA: alkaline phosphatase family protein [Bryobacteraceae bacterium]|nr:alkaline phosphatase family protein [Bryobacteraceae bacterium]